MKFWLFLFSVLAGTSAHAEQARTVMPPTVTVCFTRGEDCESRIVHEIGEARKQILVQAYGFTSPSILDAIRKAADRGVERNDAQRAVAALSTFRRTTPR